MSLPPALAKQYGPLTGAEWLAVGAVGAVGGLIYRRHVLAADAAAAAASPADSVGGVVDGTGSVGWTTTGGAIDTGSGDGTVIGGGTGSGGTVSGTPDYGGGGDDGGFGGGGVDLSGFDPLAGTNQGWLTKVESALVGAGVAPLTIESAIGAYLSGQALTPTQANIVNTALRNVGPPPEGAPAPLLAPPTAPAPVRRPATAVSQPVPKAGGATAHVLRNGVYGTVDASGKFHPYADHPAGSGWSLTYIPSSIRHETFFDAHGRTWFKKL